ncbi:hypothetical protein LC653_31035 [Nostoc sp. CHAB 5784]|uniref:hypothetical protein n=1 Tax=Nostoc mirabile TaxID=2907820 RepID=UPI001E54F588|nr:hypothetical protein [Nostoc mirabile]MCC5668178.1 hypothetical protein [Nostoc mirabile CHAB5784]
MHSALLTLLMAYCPGATGDRYRSSSKACIEAMPTVVTEQGASAVNYAAALN